MGEWLRFDSMVTPKVIILLYWLMLIGAIVTGLQTMFGGYGGATFGKLVFGAAWMVGGALGARIWCELVIVLFKIHDHLKTIAAKD